MSAPEGAWLGQSKWGGDGGREPVGGTEGGEKWVPTWFILTVEPTDFAAGCVTDERSQE